MLIFRSLAKEILTSTFVIMIIFMMVIVISRFLYFLDHAAMGLISMHDLLKMMVIIVSLFSVHVLLLSFYLSLIFVLSRFFSEHEMTALFASGFSRMHLMGYMMLLALFMSVLIGGMVLWLEPLATYSQDVVYSEAITSAELSKILPGRFESIDNGNKMVYVQDAYNKNGHRILKHVILIQHDEPTKNQQESWDITTADSAQKNYLPHNKTPYIVMSNGHRIGYVPGKLDIDKLSFDQYGIGALSHKPTLAIPVEGLPTHYLWQHRHQSLEYLSGLQYRFSIILSVFLLTLVAVPLSYVAPRQGRYLKLIPALLIYLLYMGLLLSNKNWIIHAHNHIWFYCCWLQISLLIVGLLFFRYGMGPLTHRYKRRLRKVFMPWTIKRKIKHVD